MRAIIMIVSVAGLLLMTSVPITGAETVELEREGPLDEICGGGGSSGGNVCYFVCTVGSHVQVALTGGGSISAECRNFDGDTIGSAGCQVSGFGFCHDADASALDELGIGKYTWTHEDLSAAVGYCWSGPYADIETQ